IDFFLLSDFRQRKSFPIDDIIFRIDMLHFELVAGTADPVREMACFNSIFQKNWFIRKWRLKFLKTQCSYIHIPLDKTVAVNNSSSVKNGTYCCSRIDYEIWLRFLNGFYKMISRFNFSYTTKQCIKTLKFFSGF